MSARLGTFVVLAALLAGCPPPQQYGGPIRVQPGGAAGRLHLLCRFGLRSGGDSKLCAPPPTKSRKTMQVEQLDEPTEQPLPPAAQHEGARRVARAPGEPISDDAVIEPRPDDPACRESVHATPGRE